MQHEKRNFINDELPPINATYLNGIDNALHELTHDGEWQAFTPSVPWQGFIFMRRAGNRVDVGMSELQLTNSDNIYETDHLEFFDIPIELRPKSFQVLQGICDTGAPMIQMAGASYIQLLQTMSVAMGGDPADVDLDMPIPTSMILTTKHLVQDKTVKGFGFFGSYFLD